MTTNIISTVTVMVTLGSIRRNTKSIRNIIKNIIIIITMTMMTTTIDGIDSI